MSNQKVHHMIAEAQRQSHVEVEAIAQDVYAALTALTEPLLERIAVLEREVEELKASVAA